MQKNTAQTKVHKRRPIAVSQALCSVPVGGAAFTTQHNGTMPGARDRLVRASFFGLHLYLAGK